MVDREIITEQIKFLAEYIADLEEERNVSLNEFIEPAPENPWPCAVG